MKKKKKKNNRLNYIQLSLHDFADLYPEFVSYLPFEIFLNCLQYPENYDLYFVRFRNSSFTSGIFEVGFSGDKWSVFK